MKTTKTTMELAILEAKKQGHPALAVAIYPNPADYKLAKVLCKLAGPIQTVNFVVWTYSAHDNGFHNGSYFQSYDSAFKQFNRDIENRIPA